MARDHDLGHRALPVSLLSQRARYARQAGLRAARPRGRGCGAGGAGRGGGRSVGGGRRFGGSLPRARDWRGEGGAPVGGEFPVGPRGGVVGGGEVTKKSSGLCGRVGWNSPPRPEKRWV